MVDVFTPEKRSALMARIRSKNTLPETIVRSVLRRLSFRFRSQLKDLPGKPDFVLPDLQVAIFVHGCFWHCHANCIDGRSPGSNKEYWSPKLVSNVRRDARNARKLRKLGWTVLRFWACEVEKQPRVRVEHLVRSRIEAAIRRRLRVPT
ncbi:MAG: very short patch repair endonuclease [Acidobacteriota bacterium]|nr:very short patch repair endonuclease [Acidobacteriota bacterium]